MGSFDVEAARALTPGCEHVLHFNNAGASLMPTPVIDAVVGHLELEATIGGYEAAAVAADELQDVYHAVARLIGCDPGEVALVENATRAWDMAFYSFNLKAGDRVLTGRAEYASNALAMLQVARRTGASIEVIEDDEAGQLDVEALEAAVDDDVRLIAVTHVPTNGGLVNPASQIGSIARRHDIPFLLDACQSVGQLLVDVREIGCDMLCATGRKFLRGPRGTGFLYVAGPLAERLTPPFVDLRAAEWTSEWSFELAPGARRFETWEGSVAGKLGLGAAVHHALDWGLAPIEARITALAARLRTELSELAFVSLRDKGERKSAIVTFEVADIDAGEVVRRLRDQHINTSVSLVQHARFDQPHRKLGDLVRASVHYFNTDGEVERFVAAVSAAR
jgi:cysteine desulfurase/selenocysteine lyase